MLSYCSDIVDEFGSGDVNVGELDSWVDLANETKVLMDSDEALSKDNIMVGESHIPSRFMAICIYYLTPGSSEHAGVVSGAKRGCIV